MPVQLNVADRGALNEIARMAYGSREGVDGGRGNMGLQDTSGNFRVIKFDTHWNTTCNGDKKRKLEMASNLRHRMLEIAQNAGLNEEQIGEIREKLGLTRTGSETYATSLLKRTCVAEVVRMIDDEIWDNALGEDGVDMADYSTHDRDTDFENVCAAGAGPWGGNVEKAYSRVIPDGLRTLGSRLDSSEKTVMQSLERDLDKWNFSDKAKDSYRKAVKDIFDAARKTASAGETEGRDGKKKKIVMHAKSFRDVSYNSENVDSQTLDSSDRLRFYHVMSGMRKMLATQIRALCEEIEEEAHERADKEHWDDLIQKLNRDLAGGISNSTEMKEEVESFRMSLDDKPGEQILTRDRGVKYKTVIDRMMSTMPGMIERYTKIKEAAVGFKDLGDEDKNKLKDDLAAYIKDYKLLRKDYKALKTANDPNQGWLPNKFVKDWNTIQALMREIPDSRNPMMAPELHENLPKDFFGVRIRTYQSDVHRTKDGESLGQQMIAVVDWDKSGKFVTSPRNIGSIWQDYDRTKDEIKAIGDDGEGPDKISEKARKDMTDEKAHTEVKEEKLGLTIRKTGHRFKK